MTTLSLLPTASLLCAFEKLGYGRLILLAPGDDEEALRSSSGMGTDVRRFGGVFGVVRVVEDLSRSLEDDLRVDLVDLCRLCLGAASLSLSLALEGMLMTLMPTRS